MAPWPVAGPADAAALDDFEHLRALIRGIRNVRAEKKVEQNKKIPATLVTGAGSSWLSEQRAVLAALARLDDARLTITAHADAKPAHAITLVEGATEVNLPLEGLVDLGLERARLEKELADLEKQIARGEALLAFDFVAKAPAAVVDKERAKLTAARASHAKVQARLGEF